MAVHGPPVWGGPVCKDSKRAPLSPRRVRLDLDGPACTARIAHSTATPLAIFITMQFGLPQGGPCNRPTGF